LCIANVYVKEHQYFYPNKIWVKGSYRQVGVTHLCIRNFYQFEIAWRNFEIFAAVLAAVQVSDTTQAS